MRERLWQETVERYGVNKEFVRANVDTMREVLAELKKRYTHRTIAQAQLLLEYILLVFVAGNLRNTDLETLWEYSYHLCMNFPV